MKELFKTILVFLFCICYMVAGVVLFDDLLTTIIVVLQSVFLYTLYCLLIAPKPEDQTETEEIKATRLLNK